MALATPILQLVLRLAAGLAPLAGAHWALADLASAEVEFAAYAKKNLDVLLVGSHGYGGFKTAVLGSVATRIAARCETPLLIVRA